MTDVIIKSVEELLGKLNILPDLDFFRGQSVIDYKLIPSIGRIFNTYPDVVLQFEKEIFDEFKRKCSLFSDFEPRTDFDYLFLAQHHGLPTRLLDWTFNPLVALYFATCKDFDKDACVFHSFPSTSIYRYEVGWNPFKVKENITVLPNQLNVRYRNQNGLFVIYATPYVEDLSKVLNRFIIPAKYKLPIQTKLKKIGITRSFIFPSLDSLCSEILEIRKERYSSYE